MTIQSITYNPNGPGGVGSDGGTFSGGLAAGSASATAASPSGSAGSSQTGAATPARGTTTPAATTQTASAPQQITPSGGSVTDCSGNTWAITADFRIEENGVLVPGGGDSSALAISGCTVYGLSDGENGSKTGWFTMSTVDPTGDQFWNFIGAAPASWSAPAASTTAATPTPTTPRQPTRRRPLDPPPVAGQSTSTDPVQHAQPAQPHQAAASMSLADRSSGLTERRGSPGASTYTPPTWAQRHSYCRPSFRGSIWSAWRQGTGGRLKIRHHLPARSPR